MSRPCSSLREARVSPWRLCPVWLLISTRRLPLKPNDAIIFSSNPIPGNEKAVSNIINELSMKGAKVIFQDVHVSGHACQEEIKLIYSLVRPKYAIPVHGEYRHLTAQKLVAEELGYSKDNIFILKSGNVLEIDENSAAVTGSVHTGAILVDGLGVGDVGNIVLRDRQHLSEDGIMIVVMTLETQQCGTGRTGYCFQRFCVCKRVRRPYGSCKRSGGAGS